MDASEQVHTFEEFIQQRYYDEVLEQSRTGKNVLHIDFFELTKFSPELADTLLDQPEDVIKAAELAIQSFDLHGEEGKKKFRVRFANFSDSQLTMVRNVRSEHINKFVFTEGVVRQKSDVRPQVTSARFECPSCGNVIAVLQLDTKFKEPSRCGCGRKGMFRLLSKELIDAQRIVLEEAPEDLDGGEQPKRINIFLKEDLVSPLWDKKTNPGTKIVVNGIVKEVPIILRTGGQSITFDLLIDANYVEPVEESFGELEITDEEKERIAELSKDPKLIERMVQSIAPSIYGHEKIKEAILLQLIGGVRKTRDDGIVTRGDMHVLLIGDPGSGKSQLLKRAVAIAPKARYVSGKGASGAGLTAAVVKDEFLKGWALEAGALVLANKGFCMIDELDKMSKDDTSAMHEALEQQTITISKANIQATLRAETSVLAAANPKFGRFDPYDIIAKQINLPPTLINRFDLIFPIKDIPDQGTDERLAGFILELHQNTESKPGEISTDLLRKYIAYARTKIFPKLTDGAIDEIKTYYVSMRNAESSEESIVKSVPITARQLEALVRLTEANARMRLSEQASKRDAKRAIDILDFCLRNIGLDQKTGKIDIDRIATSIPSSERGQIIIVKEIITLLEKKIKEKTIPVDLIMQEAEMKGIERAKTEEIIERLKRQGDIFEPSRGGVQRMY